MNGHRHLAVWQDARILVQEVYALTRSLPSEERHVATPQLRRAAWSVQNNIAEGNAKLGTRELRRFLDIALGSLAEVDSMVATLPVVHSLSGIALGHVGHIERLRVRVNRGIFVSIRSRRGEAWSRTCRLLLPLVLPSPPDTLTHCC